VSPDRYGDPQPRTCRNPNCRKGWLGEDDEGRPIPCLECKDHLLRGTSTTHDFAERIPSARAQQAINESDNRE
jgi:hypothetical protein